MKLTLGDISQVNALTISVHPSLLDVVSVVNSAMFVRSARQLLAPIVVFSDILQQSALSLLCVTNAITLDIPGATAPRL